MKLKEVSEIYMREKSGKVVCFLVGLLLIAGLTSGVAAVTEDKEEGISSPEKQIDIEGKWGIRILGIRLSAGGNILDLRYKVLDTAKSSLFFDRKTKPYLVSQTNGAKLFVPNDHKLGPLRQTPKNPAANKNYFIFFANPGVVKSGDKVTVVIGDFRAENLIVE